MNKLVLLITVFVIVLGTTACKQEPLEKVTEEVLNVYKITSKKIADDAIFYMEMQGTNNPCTNKDLYQIYEDNTLYYFTDAFPYGTECTSDYYIKTGEDVYITLFESMELGRYTFEELDEVGFYQGISKYHRIDGRLASEVTKDLMLRQAEYINVYTLIFIAFEICNHHSNCPAYVEFTAESLGYDFDEETDIVYGEEVFDIDLYDITANNGVLLVKDGDEWYVYLEAKYSNGTYEFPMGTAWSTVDFVNYSDVVKDDWDLMN